MLALRAACGEGAQLRRGPSVSRRRHEEGLRGPGRGHPPCGQSRLPGPLRKGADGRRHGANQPGEGGHHQLVPARPQADRLQTGAQGPGHGSAASAQAHAGRQKEENLQQRRAGRGGRGGEKGQER